MFQFIKKCFFAALTFLTSINSLNAIPLSCISMKNQECKTRPQVVNVNGNNPIFYPFSIKTSKCSGNCDNINNSYAKICVPDVIKDLNVKVFNLMPKTNKTSFTEWCETYKCKCRLDPIVCNNKKCWNENKCRYECKELIAKGVCDKGFFGILVIVSVKVIKRVILVNIYTMKIVNAEKN